MLISDCRREPESLLLNCMMSLSFCAGCASDQPPAEALLLNCNHDLPEPRGKLSFASPRITILGSSRRPPQRGESHRNARLRRA